MEFAHESSIALLKILLDIGHVFPCSLDTSLPALVCLPLWLSTLSLNRLPCPSLSGRPACIYAVCFPPPVPIRVCTQRHVCMLSWVFLVVDPYTFVSSLPYLSAWSPDWLFMYQSFLQL